MEGLDEYDAYLAYLCAGLGHVDRHQGLRDYCRGLTLEIPRKSVEPMAASLCPERTEAKHQTMHGFVAESAWSDADLRERVRQWVWPALVGDGDYYLIGDDTGQIKKGEHSVGVDRQYCGQVGKVENCQISVTLSVATEAGSLPVDQELYLPRPWAEDRVRRKKTGIPWQVKFRTKTTMAVAQVERALQKGMRPRAVLFDAGYGNDSELRDGLEALGLPYCVGIQSPTTVWAPGDEPAPLRPWNGRGRPATRRQPEPGGAKPVAVKILALNLAPAAWTPLTWREGANAPLSSRFAAVRVRCAHGPWQADRPPREEWLLIEWPPGVKEPTQYWLSTLDEATTLAELVRVAKLRWRIERDYREMKQHFGLSDYEGRNWRGFHHHWSLVIAVYGFVMAQRLRNPERGKKWGQAEAPVLSRLPSRGFRRANPAPCHRFHCHADPPAGSRHRSNPAPLPLLRPGQRGLF